MMNNYEEKKQARIDRYKARAGKAKQESLDLFEQSDTMARAIPFGQPILVGHHSEQGDRNYREKIWNKMGKSVEADKKAEYWADRAESAEKSTAVSSDDPEAVEKLGQKIKVAQELQEQMKAENKILRNTRLSEVIKRERLSEKFGWSVVEIDNALKPDVCGEVGHPPWELQNNNANIRRMKLRLVKLQKQSQESSSAYVENSVRVVENVEENRVQLFFPDKPSAEIRKVLKSYGFRWTPSIGAWQRHRSNQATYFAQKIVAKYGL